VLIVGTDRDTRLRREWENRLTSLGEQPSQTDCIRLGRKESTWDLSLDIANAILVADLPGKGAFLSILDGIFGSCARRRLRNSKRQDVSDQECSKSVSVTQTCIVGAIRSWPIPNTGGGLGCCNSRKSKPHERIMRYCGIKAHSRTWEDNGSWRVHNFRRRLCDNHLAG
jgi:hypothetical protein